MASIFNGEDSEMNFWLILGFSGQLLFALRFLVQWVCSERRQESYIPVVFWYFSLGGGVILLLYAIHIKDPVFILGQSTGVVVYLRNLSLIHRKKSYTNNGSEVFE